MCDNHRASIEERVVGIISGLYGHGPGQQSDLLRKRLGLREDAMSQRAQWEGVNQAGEPQRLPAEKKRGQDREGFPRPGGSPEYNVMLFVKHACGLNLVWVGLKPGQPTEELAEGALFKQAQSPS